MITAIVAQTKASAQKLAHDLGIETRHVFGARMRSAFEGLRADLVLIDADAELDDRFMSVIRSTVTKRSGQVRAVRVRPA